MNLAGLFFASPWALTALAALPAVWFLARFIPPPPRRLVFPPAALVPQRNDPPPPKRSPPWLLLLRLAAVACIPLALSAPAVPPNPFTPNPQNSQRPLIILFDDGWASAPAWNSRRDALDAALSDAAALNRPAALLLTAQPLPENLAFSDAAEIRSRTFQPSPWTPKPAAVAAWLAEDAQRNVAKNADLLYIQDGLLHNDPLLPDAPNNNASDAPNDSPNDEPDDAANNSLYSNLLRAAAHVSVLQNNDLNDAWTLQYNRQNTAPNSMALVARRPVSNAPAQDRIFFFNARGDKIADVPVSFPVGAREAHASLVAPLSLRNSVSRVALAQRSSAASSFLFDPSARKHSVVIIGDDPDASPFLSGSHYIRKALEPLADVSVSNNVNSLNSDVSIAVLNDKPPPPNSLQRLEDWIRQGGTLLRFIGDNLMDATNNDDADNLDPLFPVPLSPAPLRLEGSLSWGQARTVAPFHPDSPLFGIPLDADARVRTLALPRLVQNPQYSVLARVSVENAPLISSKPLGKGQIILFHTSVNPLPDETQEWSNLHLSGFFPAALQRIAQLAPPPGAPSRNKSSNPKPPKLLPPVLLLNGFGVPVPPSPDVLPLPADEINSSTPSRQRPPGLYGDFAFNLAPNAPHPVARNSPPSAVSLHSPSRPLPLAPWILAFALVLFLTEGFLVNPPKIPGAKLPLAARALIVAFAFAIPAPAFAQTPADARSDAELARRPALAFVIDSDPQVNSLSLSAMTSLSKLVSSRTSFKPAPPRPIHPNTHSLILHPLVYWPVIPNHTELSPTALQRINEYIQTGGVLVFDSRDAHIPAHPSLRPAHQAMSQILRQINVGPLVRADQNHILTRTFYFLSGYPGRFAPAPLYVLKNPTPQQDRVSPVVVGSADWIGAWALQSQLPVLPDGDAQRREALNFGVNLVVYALTGNYKEDQRNLPSVIRRLSQRRWRDAPSDSQTP